jgi:thiol-disulfide isomerase/thioredoxin
MKCMAIRSLLFLSLFGQTDRPFALTEERQDSDQAARDDGFEEPARRTQWLMFTAAWCPACRAARADFGDWLKRGGWKVDFAPDAHVRLVDVGQETDLVRAFAVRSIPTFVLLRDGVEVWRTEGYPGRRELVDRFLAAHREAVGAIPIGTLRGQRQNIAEVIAALRPWLGDEGTLTVTLDRPGAAVPTLPLGEWLSVQTPNPLTMTYALRNDVLTCRFAKPYPRGRFTLGVPIEQTISAVSVSVSEVVIELPRAPDVRLRVAP